MKNTAPNDSRFLDLLQRWLRGDFRRADEQALQELVSGDEFRSEALEGYQLLPGEDHQARLESLQGRLRSRVPGARRVAILPRLLAIAAVLSLLVLAVWFVPGLFRENVPEIAQKSPSVSSDTEVSQPATPDESASAPIEAAGPHERTERISEEKSLSSPAGNIASAMEDRPSDTLSEAFADMETAPLADAPPAVLQPAEALLQEDKAMQKKPASPPEAVRSKETVGIPFGRPAADQSSLGGQPVMGWAAFNDYLRKNARLTPEARNNNISGPVKLEFSIDDAGKPTDFIILQPLGFGCDEKAVELVRSLQWLPGAGGRTQVEVWFRR